MSAPLFDALDEVAARVRAAPHLLLGCDFDGALAPVYDNPAAPTLSAEVRRPLTELAATGRVTVLVGSGRPAGDLRAHANIPNLIVAGNHGLELSGPDWEHVDPAVAETEPLIHQLAEKLTKALEPIAEADVEDRRLSVAVRCREGTAECRDAVRSAVHQVLANSSHPFVLTTGPRSFDIRARVYWTKGEAIKWLLAHVGQPDALVVFVGGDPTDEDAFAALPDGISVRVGHGPETAARYHVDGPDGVRKFLEWLRDQLR